MSADQRRRPRGFSLVEVLIALAIIIALGGTIYGFLHGLLDTRAQATRHMTRQRAVDTLFDRVEANLTTCLADGGSHGSGIIGSGSELAILSRGVAPGRGRRAAFGDLQRTTYRFRSGTHRLEARREVLTGTPTTDRADAVEDADAAPPSPAFSPIGEDIHLVRFRYHDGSTWVERYDAAAARRLPVAVEIAVWFDAWPGAEDAASTGAVDEDVDDDDDAPERLTFDPTAGFDERAVAVESDLDLAFGDVPPPDRVRVIAIPDVRPPRSSEAEAETGGAR